MNIILGDCYEKLMELKAQNLKADLLLTDPPYVISRETNFHTMKGRENLECMEMGKSFDDHFDIQNFIPLVVNVLKENANVVIFCARDQMQELSDVCKANHICIKRWLVLSKSNPAPFNRDRMFVNDVEFAIWGIYNSKDKQTGWTFNRQNAVEKCVIPTKVQSKSLHPTMKDLDVISHLVKVLSNENDIVLDPFMGSGTTGLACKNLKRHFVGIEKEEKYVKIAIDRINKA